MCSSDVLNRRSSNSTSSSYFWYTFTVKATYKRRKAVVTGEYASRVHDLTMAGFDNNSSSIIGKCILLMFLIIIQVTGQEDCNEANCPGQLIVRYYKGIGCTPIYANPNDCCAEAYDCSHLDNLSRDKCYVNGHEYSVGEMLRPEDSNPCDWNCTCTQYENTAFFQCEKLNDCNSTEEQGCLYRKTHGLCCEGFCDMEETDNTTCNVDGKVYKAGEYFYPNANPKLLCICMEGYAGENIEPFCQQLNRDPCSALFTVAAAQVHDKLIPLFIQFNYFCPVTFYRYPSPNDSVISKHDNNISVPVEGNVICQHGNLTLHIGEELSPEQPVEVWSIGTKCVCEVPPYVTCYKPIASPEEDKSQENFYT
ncbi:uncharacterized protein LOC126919334 isoform X1 [Bombus affinis]|uniref:uncharacterized protein LOC126919334 isoform X1 n=1 Tax=Bombus affinis TaxID=309941 RepID=UPI0021B764CB|nr:uncharacterized protein LOC126919334 isoform X1 [Bombus affinis]